MRRSVAVVALVLLAGVLATSGRQLTHPGPTGPMERPAATPPESRTPAPPRLRRDAINTQDRTTQRHREIESQAFDSRPLVSRLPIARAGVRIDVGGLASDDRHTVLSIDPGARTRAYAREVYRRALRHAGDPGSVYVLEWAR